MVSTRLPLKQTYLDILALSAWGILFIFYWLSDQLKLLIHPRYVGVVVVAGLMLLGLAVSRAVSITTARPAPSEHITALPKSFSSGLMLAIAVAALIVPIQPLGSQAA
ncbi:TIGR03943 family protein, partial [filamentous cyanobacterium CCP5]